MFIIAHERALQPPQRSRTHLHEQIIPCKQISHMRSAFLQPFPYLNPRSRQLPSLPPREPPQAWNPDPWPPNRPSSKPPPPPLPPQSSSP